MDTRPSDSTRVCVRGCTRARRHLAACQHKDDPGPLTCDGCLPRPADHGDLCWGCHRRLELMLYDAPTVVDWLVTQLAAGGTQGLRQDWQRPGGEDGSPAPVKLDVLVLTDTIAASLAGWVDSLVERTSLVGPALRRVSPWDVTAETRTSAGFLFTHLTAVENQPFVAPMWDELARLTSEAHALAPWRPPVKRLGEVPCPECAAATLVIYGGDDHISCQRCHAAIPAARYDLWVKIIAEDASR